MRTSTIYTTYLNTHPLSNACYFIPSNMEVLSTLSELNATPKANAKPQPTAQGKPQINIQLPT